MRSFSKIILIVVLGCLITSSSFAKREVKEAVVKIYTVYNEHDYYEPWQMFGQLLL